MTTRLVLPTTKTNTNLKTSRRRSLRRASITKSVGSSTLSSLDNNSTSVSVSNSVTVSNTNTNTNSNSNTNSNTNKILTPILVKNGIYTKRRHNKTDSTVERNHPPSHHHGHHHGHHVHFSTVSIREYNTILGDNPACRSGPPLTLGWKYDKKKKKKKRGSTSNDSACTANNSTTGTANNSTIGIATATPNNYHNNHNHNHHNKKNKKKFKIDDYERMRNPYRIPANNPEAMIISVIDRTKILEKRGYSREEMWTVSIQCSKIQMERLDSMRCFDRDAFIKKMRIRMGNVFCHGSTAGTNTGTVSIPVPST